MTNKKQGKCFKKVFINAESLFFSMVYKRTFPDYMCTLVANGDEDDDVNNDMMMYMYIGFVV